MGTYTALWLDSQLEDKMYEHKIEIYRSQLSRCV